MTKYVGAISICVAAALVSCHKDETASEFAANQAAVNTCGSVEGHLLHQPFEVKKSGMFSTDDVGETLWGVAAARPTVLSALPEGGYKIGWTDTAGSVHVTRLDEAGLVANDLDLGNMLLRDMIGHDQGAAVLYFNGSQMSLRRIKEDGKAYYDNAGSMTSKTSGGHSGALAYFDNKYAVYFGVSGNDGWNNGHEGDAYKVVSAANGSLIQNGWDWGCSHSIDQRVVASSGQFVPVCLSDTYPSPGIHANHSSHWANVAGDTSGNTSGRLGGFAGMKNQVVLAYLQSAGYARQVRVLSASNQAPFSRKLDYSYPSVSNQSQSSVRIARLGENDLLLAWREGSSSSTMVQVLNSDLAPRTKPFEIKDNLSLLRSDFKTAPNGNVVWVSRNPKAKDNQLILNTFGKCSEESSFVSDQK